MAKWCARHDVAVWAYCLMPNHVHLILTPAHADGLARAVGEAHRRYTLAINTRQEWKGFLWQGRFASYPMDSSYLMNAARYVLLNPVRAKLVRDPTQWQHSSVHAHLTGRRDGLVDPTPLGQRVQDWDEFLRVEDRSRTIDKIRRHQRSGRPMGSAEFIRGLEVTLGRSLFPRKPGPKTNTDSDTDA